MGVSLNDLRGLAVQLPPSERVMSSEVADVVSALSAIGHYGEEIIDAAKEGKIGDFFHQVAVDAAKEAGEPEPRRGAIPAPVVTPAAPATSGALESEVAKLRNDVSELIAALRGANAPAPSNENATSDTTVTESSS